MSSLLKTCISIAIEAHGNDTRKFSNNLYVTHPIAVMNLLSKMMAPLYLGLANIIASAAVLHDVVEDTPNTAKDLRQRLEPLNGGVVVDIVEELSEVKYDEEGNRLPWVRRKAEHMARMRTASNEAILIKMADCLDNLNDTLEQARINPDSVNNFRGTTDQQRVYRCDIADLANGKIAFSQYRDIAKELGASIVSRQTQLDAEMANYRGSK